MTFNPVTSHGNGYPLGLTGAVSPTRYVGGTASVAPTTGTFAAGDFVVTLDGKVWVCTVAGTPGTWTQVGSGGGLQTTYRAQGSVYNAANQWYISDSLYATTNTAFATTDQRCYMASPIILPHDITIDQLGVFIQTIAGAAGSVVRLGIYTVSSPQQLALAASYGTLLYDAGTIDSTTTGVKTLALGAAQTISAYTAFACVFAAQGAPAVNPQVNCLSHGSGVLSSPFGMTSIANPSQMSHYMTGVSGALPATYTPSAFVTSGLGGGANFRRSA